MLLGIPLSEAETQTRVGMLEGSRGDRRTQIHTLGRDLGGFLLVILLK